MRRAIPLFVVVALTVLFVAPTASATPKVAKGCPAEASIWTQVSYITSTQQGNYKETSLYQYYWVSLPEAATAFAAQFDPPKTEEEQYFTVTGWIDVIDRNQDDTLCAWWIGGTPGQWDGYVSTVDNNSNAQT